MPRDIDDKKRRKALRKLRKAAERAEAEGGPGLSDWEREFVDEVEARVEKYGSAFANPEKGNLDEPLSSLQTQKLKEIDKKSRGKGSGFKQRSGFKSKKKPSFKPRVRDINADEPDEAENLSTPPPSRRKLSKLPKLVKASELASSTPEPQTPDTNARAEVPQKTGKRPVFKVIKGGKKT